MEKKKVSVKIQLVQETIPMLFVVSVYIVNGVGFFKIPYSETITNLIWIGYFAYGLTLFRKKDIFDELAEKILGKVDKICINITKISIMGLMILIAGQQAKDMSFNRDIVGIFLSIVLMLITILRPILYSYYERKGIS